MSGRAAPGELSAGLLVHPAGQRACGSAVASLNSLRLPGEKMHKRLSFIALVLLVIGLPAPVAGADVALGTRSLLGGLVEMLVPTSFQPMPEDLLKLKYPMERRPTLVLANETGSVSVALNHTRDHVPLARLAEFHRALEGSFRRLYPSAVWFRSELTALNGRQFILLELRTPALDTEIRNLMLATSVDERMLLIAVNMTTELESQWLGPAHRMFQSVTVKK